MNELGEILLNDVDEPVRDPYLLPFSAFGLSPSLTTPPAPPVQPKDADKALVNTALGTFRLNGWLCQEDQEYRSFVVSVKVRSQQRGVLSTENFRVYAENGVLYFDQLALDLPFSAIGGLPIMETLNEINQRSVSSVFMLGTSGIAIRHAMIPRGKEDGYFSAAMLVQTLRQMYHDRRNGLSLLRQVMESRMLDPLFIARAFANPVLPTPAGGLTLEQAENLANFAGFITINDGRQLYLSRDKMPPDRCPVRVNCGSGMLRGHTVIGDVQNGKFSWKFMPSRLRSLIKTDSASKIHERLNALNLRHSPVRYVAARKSLVAMSMAFATDQDITVEQFKQFASALLEHSENGAKAVPLTLTRRAG